MNLRPVGWKDFFGKPSDIPAVPGGMLGRWPIFRPTQGPGAGPASGGGHRRGHNHPRGIIRRHPAS